MKIAQVLTSSGWGGTETVFILLVNELSRKHDVTVITYDNPAILKELSPNVKPIIIPETSRKNLWGYWLLYRIFVKESFDIVHTHGAKASTMVYWLSRILPICQIATKHNSRKGSIFNKISNTTAVSRTVARSIKNETMVIHNGINVISREIEDQRHDPFRIMAIGRLDPIKGFDLLIEQVAKLDIPFQLDIVGDGPEKNKLLQKIDHLGLAGQVFFKGYQNNIPERMGQVDLIVISSRSEGFSMVAVESLFYGKVLLSTHIGISQDLLDDSLLVGHENLAVKIKEIALNYEKFRNCFKATQKKYQREFSIEHVTTVYEELFKRSVPHG
ncbi:MAG: glycosyltransferase [Deltaproteobacteria bacterium]|nr:glycosyltransferase [Deltaproteobacteria bacterium]